ncbi:branched chain amino acid ABC transporter substrate-binding protein [Desulfosarcina widdelii]|uniref:Branched chain amino acid ABC transporter substrate-binding protein n=1 Tax=Desulfosarcina widdelii TaxID=947919 RepID=A0A5K7Z411_9BACT|nr:branched-chain amino acid ABC transporter substrate-binding protein [Desulfosarcina widdelii]BBO75718.1 branched chain amino acid ABC transporter substrate-binding protein [Desulfosarcina widdelii]
MKTKSIWILINVFILFGYAHNAAQAEIKVGIAGPLSGISVNLGEQQEIGAQKAIEHQNDKGGLLGNEIVAISVDDACEPRQAKAVAKQLVSEGVVFVVGHGCSACSLAATPIYEKAGIIMISPASTNPKVTEEGGDNVFRVIGRDDQQGTIAGNYLADHFGNSKIAIIHDGQAYGLGLASFTKRQLNQRGISEFLFDRYTPDQKDYKPLVNKLVQKNIDVLYAGGYLTDIGIILRQAKKELPNLRLFSGDTLVNVEFLFVAGEAGTGTYFTFGPDMRQRPEAQEVAAAIREEDAYEPDGYTLYSYGAVQAWAQAVEQAGSLKPNAVIRALRSGSFDTVIGKIGFDEKGDVTGISTFVWYVFGKEDYSLAK